MSLVEAARAFDEAALRVNDVHPANLVRWAGPIFMAIAESDDIRPLAPQIEASVRLVAGFAGIPVALVAIDHPQANFLIRRTETAGRAACRTAIYSRGGRIARVEVAIHPTPGAAVTRCINHEVMHAFGFRSHAHAAQSILSYRQTAMIEHSPLDRLLLETLYDPRLQPGMELSSAGVAACSILAEKLGVARRDAAAHCARRAPEGGRLAVYEDGMIDHQPGE
jgi:hypothetical protein